MKIFLKVPLKLAASQVGTAWVPDFGAISVKNYGMHASDGVNALVCVDVGADVSLSSQLTAAFTNYPVDKNTLDSAQASLAGKTLGTNWSSV